MTIDKLEDQSDLLNLLPWLQCSASLGTTCFHSCQLQAGIFLQLLWAVFQGSTLLVSADVPVDFMFFFEEINANPFFYMLYCQIMLNIGVSCKFPIQLQPIR